MEAGWLLPPGLHSHGSYPRKPPLLPTQSPGPCQIGLPCRPSQTTVSLIFYLRTPLAPCVQSHHLALSWFYTRCGCLLLFHVSELYLLNQYNFFKSYGLVRNSPQCCTLNLIQKTQEMNEFCLLMFGSKRTTTTKSSINYLCIKMLMEVLLIQSKKTESNLNVQ